jgi:glyoxylase-like metal-dependent hydrolase (beta-lactamase superfamily II)
MQVQRIEVTIAPGFRENCYILSDAPDATHVVVVDPGAEPRHILNAVGERTIDSIVLTHRHYDHTGALAILMRKIKAEVIAHSLDAEAIPESVNPIDTLKNAQLKKTLTIRTVEDGDLVAVGSAQLRVLHTPGHTIGSMCLYDEEGHVLIAGDTLFYGAVGRTDLETGNAAQQVMSLRKLATLPDDTVVYPGHDRETTIGRERKSGYLGLVRQP